MTSPTPTNPSPAEPPRSGPSRHDVVVVGGGAAGLSAAVTLARSLRDILVVDAGEPRNAPAEAAHNLLGREGVPPLELLEAGRAEARAYGAEIRAGATALPGVWAAGNAGDLTAMVGAAAAQGVMAGAAINADLVQEEVRAAVQRRAALAGR